MPASLMASGELLYWIAAIVLIMARVGLIVFFMPGIGEQAVPVRVRAMIVLVFSISLAASGLIQFPVITGMGDFFGLFLAEVTIAIMLAWPFVAVNLLYNICLGFINKALPSLMVAFVGAPFMIGAGILLLAFSISTILVVWADKAPAIIGWL